jgi:hypothetical protein
MAEPKSYDEIIEFIASGAQAVVAVSSVRAVQERVAELLERSKGGVISAEEKSELENRSNGNIL